MKRTFSPEKVIVIDSPLDLAARMFVKLFSMEEIEDRIKLIEKINDSDDGEHLVTYQIEKGNLSV